MSDDKRAEEGQWVGPKAGSNAGSASFEPDSKCPTPEIPEKDELERELRVFFLGSCIKYATHVSWVYWLLIVVVIALFVMGIMFRSKL